MKTALCAGSAFLIAIATAILFNPSRADGQGFPPIGYAAGPGVVLTVDANGFLTVTSTGEGPYDNIEDTYVGIINNSSTPLCGIHLQSPNAIFAFDGDGPCGIDPNTGQPFQPSPCSPTNNFGGRTGYEGPRLSFDSINVTKTAGTVKFNPPLGQGESTWFGLEEAIQITCNPISGIVHKSQGCGKNSVCPTTPTGCDAASWTCAGYARYDTNVDPQDTIGQWGCNLTACVMLVNYHAGTDKSPKDLNDFLNTQADGWTGDGATPCDAQKRCNGPNPRAVVRYAHLLGATGLSYVGGLPFRRPTGCQSAGGTSNDFVVNSYLCSAILL